jgi:membrane protease YdiL (CAAX protease family)
MNFKFGIKLQRPELIYLIVAFLITWLLTIACFLLYKAAIINIDQLNILYNLGALGPPIAAWYASYKCYSSNGPRALLQTLRFRSVGRRVWLTACSPLVFLFLGLLIFPLLNGEPYSFSYTQAQMQLSSPTSYAGWLLPFFTYSVLEEFGWRGFLLPHLQERYSAYRATIILTVFWALWHLPFFLWRMQFSVLITVGFFFAIFIGSIILTNIFNSAAGSIVPVITFHFANNLASALDKRFLVVIISMGFIFSAILIVRKYGPENLSHLSRIKNFYRK